ncbi:MAG: hypothetical protein ACRDYC_01460, partial [Acidimicrobiales bacterium]
MAVLTLAGGIAFPVASTATPLGGGVAAAAASGGNYVPVNPTRITDTRTGSGQANAGQTLAAGGSLNVSAGPNVPNGSAAVAVTITAVDGTQSGFLSAYPTGGTLPPLESVVNYRPGPENCTALDCVVPNL